jgi:hypothetical protein
MKCPSDHPQILGFVANVTGIINVSSNSISDIDENHRSGKNLGTLSTPKNISPNFD